MKRSLFTFVSALFLILITSVTQLYAIQLVNESGDRDRRIALNELREFKRVLDQFSYLLMVGDIGQAQQTKNRIVELMDEEIEQKMRIMDLSAVYDRNNRQVIIDQNRYALRDPSEALMMDRLIRQQELRDSFIRSRLDRGKRARRMERRHREIMYEFRKIMTDELQNTNNFGDQQARSVRW